MAFGKITKQDLLDAGLDVDKFAGLIGTATTKDELNAMKTEMNTTLQGIKDSLAELTTKFTARSNDNDQHDQNRGNNDEQNRGNNSGNNGNQAPDIFAVDPIEFATDPGAHLKKVAGVLVNDSRTQTMSIRRDNAYDRLSLTLPWFKNSIIKDEVDKKWLKYTPQAMVNLNIDPMIALREIYDSVVGAHHDDIMQDRDKKDGKFNLIQTGGSNRTENNNNQGDQRTAEQQLTPHELSAAKSFGMTPEEYLKSQNDLIGEGKYVRQ